MSVVCGDLRAPQRTPYPHFLGKQQALISKCVRPTPITENPNELFKMLQ
jgi:hypothetical protein